MMTAPGQFPNAPNLLSAGTSFNWYPDTTHPEHRAQDGLGLQLPPQLRSLKLVRVIPMGQPPRSQIYSERGFGFFKAPRPN